MVLSSFYNFKLAYSLLDLLNFKSKNIPFYS